MWKEAVTMHKFPGSIVINGKSPSLLKAQVVLGSEPMMYIHSTTLPPPPCLSPSSLPCATPLANGEINQGALRAQPQQRAYYTSKKGE